MKNKSTTAVLWALVLLLVLSPLLQTTAMAADVTTEVAPQVTIAPPKQGRTIFPPCCHWLFSMGLRLSEGELTLKLNESHDLTVVPNQLAQLLGWSIKEVKVDGQTIEVTAVDKIALKATIKGLKNGKTTIEIHLVNSHYLPSMVRVLKCTVTVKTPTRPSSSHSGWHVTPPAETTPPSEPGTDPNPGTPPTDPGTAPNPGTEQNKFDTSNLAFDTSSLSFVYDGQEHRPTLVGVPDGVEVVWRTEPVTNAGSNYIVTVGFKVPDGYEAIPDMTTSFEITKAEVSTDIRFDEENGKIVVGFDGLIPGEATAKSYVNGVEFTDEFAITDFGRYVTTTEVNVDLGKVDNYTGLDTIEKVYNVQRQNTWYNLSTEVEQVGDQVFLKVYISDIKVRQDPEEAVVSIGFNVDFNRDALEQHFADDSSPQDVSEGSWMADYWSEGSVNGTYDVSALYFDVPLTDKDLICTLVYDVLPGKEVKDLTFTITDAELSSTVVIDGEEDVLTSVFSYTTNDSTVVLNPSEDAPAEETILQDNDLIQDAIFQDNIMDPDSEYFYCEQEFFEEQLQGFIDSGFQTYPAETQTEETAEPEPVEEVETEESSGEEATAETGTDSVEE